MSKESSQKSQSKLGLKVLPAVGLCCHWQAGRILLSRGSVERSSVPREGSWSFYLPDFFLEDSEPWWIPAEVELIEASPEGGEPLLTRRNKRQWVVDEPGPFFALVAELKQLFAQGTLKKGVPVVLARSAWRPSAEELPVLLQTVIQRARHSPHLRPYAWWTPAAGMVGLSPEVLFMVRDGRLTTMALAGTRRGGFIPGELLADPKERFEHRLVIEDLAAQMASLGSVHIGETQECHLGSLSHLKTELSVELERAWHFEELVEVFHPTAALGAYPRASGREWLRTRRPAEANRFGAPFGVRSPQGEMVCLVAIRNIQWNDQGALLASGCGIVAPSDPEREWQELELKRQFVLEGLGL